MSSQMSRAGPSRSRHVPKKAHVRQRHEKELNNGIHGRSGAFWREQTVVDIVPHRRPPGVVQVNSRTSTNPFLHKQNLPKERIGGAGRRTLLSSGRPRGNAVPFGRFRGGESLLLWQSYPFVPVFCRPLSQISRPITTNKPSSHLLLRLGIQVEVLPWAFS